MGVPLAKFHGFSNTKSGREASEQIIVILIAADFHTEPHGVLVINFGNHIAETEAVLRENAWAGVALRRTETDALTLDRKILNFDARNSEIDLRIGAQFVESETGKVKTRFVGRSGRERSHP